VIPKQLKLRALALKPFQARLFVSSGRRTTRPAAVIGAWRSPALHPHPRPRPSEAFKILWSADLEAERLQCPHAPTRRQPLEQKLLGKHAAFPSPCRRNELALESYLQTDHPPARQSCFKQVGELLGLPGAELSAASR